MTLARILAAPLAAGLLAAAPLPALYTAPAGDRVSGAPNPTEPFDVVLPNGRIVAPVGRSVAVGVRSLGVALARNGKYAVVTNDDVSGAPGSSSGNGVRPGFSLAVVDTSTMVVTDVYAPDGAQFFLGVAAARDPASPADTLLLAAGGASDQLYFLHLDSFGKLTQAAPSVAIPGVRPGSHAFPGWIALAPNGRTAYVVNAGADTVTAFDLASRQATGTAAVGFSPYAAAVAGERLYVTDPGLMQYTALPAPATAPQFANVGFSPESSSALTGLQLAGQAFSAGGAVSMQMDQAPDGVNLIGGAHPAAISVSKNKRYAYVCMTNVDRIAIVDLLGTPRVIGGLQLRLFDKSPYGTQPDAIALSPDGKRLYVALAGMNAVAVLDARNPVQLHRLGLIPTGWYPSGIAISSNGRYLYVANAKGTGQWATLQRIDLHKLPLGKTTLSALKYNRTAVRPVENPIVPPLRSGAHSSVISHVVFILEGKNTYDAALGDLTDPAGRPWGKGDPSLVSSGVAATPNLHALAYAFGLAANYYAEAGASNAGHQFAAAGIATPYVEKTLALKSAPDPFDPANQDPEDYPRDGYIFNALYRAGLTYRDYGDFLRVSGYDAGEIPGTAAATGLGGSYTLDTPALAALNGRVDLNYPGWNPRISDVRRAQEFVSDYTRLEHQDAVPAFTYIWLPDDGQAAEGDRALGTIVDFLSHRPEWNSTAIFIAADGTGGRDHVDPHRAYAIVVSPYAKRHYVGPTHTSTASVLKTEDELLGLQPLSLGDLLSSDMSDFFQATPDLTPYSALPVPAQGAEVRQEPNDETVHALKTNENR